MQIVKLNLIPGGVLPVCFASQHDTGRVIRFMLFEGEIVFTLSGAETIALRLQKPDGSELVESVTNTGADYVDVVTTADTCDMAGASVGEIAITDGGDVLGSGNFDLFVESDAFEGGGIVTQTATGAIATFETNIETAFVSLKSDINPVQDLHGYSKPWSGGGGKNKFNDTTGTHTINANTDNTITIGDVYLEANTTYTISCKQTPAPLTSFVRNTLSVVGGGTTTYNPAGNDYTIKPMVFTPTVSGTYSIRVWGHTLPANTTYSQFQVEVGSTATAYEPYSNICPISGFSALNVTLADGDMQTVDTATVNFGQTVYGGVVDVTNGKLTITHRIINLWDFNFSYNSGDATPHFTSNSAISDSKNPSGYGTIANILCSQYDNSKSWGSAFGSAGNNGYIALTPSGLFGISDDRYTSPSDFKTALQTENAKLVYELATPIEITTTPENLTAIVGVNNVYADTNGDTEVEYYIEV